MVFLLVSGKRTRDFAFVSLCYRGSGEDMCTGYAMAASGQMRYDYKQTNFTITPDYNDIFLHRLLPLIPDPNYLSFQWYMPSSCDILEHPSGRIKRTLVILLSKIRD